MRLRAIPSMSALIVLVGCATHRTNWPPVGYAEIRAYLYNLEGDQAAPIVKQGKLHATVWNPEGEPLDKKQMATVQKAVVDYHPAGLSPLWALCYQPRHAVVYYDAENKLVGFV